MIGKLFAGDDKEINLMIKIKQKEEKPTSKPKEEELVLIIESIMNKKISTIEEKYKNEIGLM